MRNFLQVGTIDTLPLRMALQRSPDLWNKYRYRTTFDGSPFGGMDDILLRYSRPELHEGICDPNAVLDDTALVFYPAWQQLTEARPIIFDLMRRFEGISLGRVIVARLPPGGRIEPHADDHGDYAKRRDGMRFHIAIQGQPGCLFNCGGETVQMLTGQVWHFNHQAEHSAFNNSGDDRIHLLVDIQTG